MKQKEKPIVSKEWLIANLQTRPEVVIGRALVAIYNNQTQEEKNSSTTIFRNGRGFSSSDAVVGTKGAQMYMKNQVLPPWQIKLWSSLNSKGVPRLCKYARQLNEIATQKARN